MTWSCSTKKLIRRKKRVLPHLSPSISPFIQVDPFWSSHVYSFSQGLFAHIFNSLNITCDHEPHNGLVKICSNPQTSLKRCLLLKNNFIVFYNINVKRLFHLFHYILFPPVTRKVSDVYTVSFLMDYRFYRIFSSCGVKLMTFLFVLSFEGLQVKLFITFFIKNSIFEWDDELIIVTIFWPKHNKALNTWLWSRLLTFRLYWIKS